MSQINFNKINRNPHVSGRIVNLLSGKGKAEGKKTCTRPPVKLLERVILPILSGQVQRTPLIDGISNEVSKMIERSELFHSIYSEIKSYFKKFDEPKEQLEALTLSLRAFAQMGKKEEVFGLCESAKIIIKKGLVRSSMYWNERKIIEILFNLGEPEKALEVMNCNKAELLARIGKEDWEKLENYGERKTTVEPVPEKWEEVIGGENQKEFIINMAQSGEPGKAVSFLMKMNKAQKKLFSLDDTAEVFSKIALAFARTGEGEKALTWADKALKYQSSFSKYINTPHEYLAETFALLAKGMKNKRKEEEAKEYIDKAWDLFQKVEPSKVNYSYASFFKLAREMLEIRMEINGGSDARLERELHFGCSHYDEDVRFIYSCLKFYRKIKARGIDAALAVATNIPPFPELLSQKDCFLDVLTTLAEKDKAKEAKDLLEDKVIEKCFHPQGFYSILLGLLRQDPQIDSDARKALIAGYREVENSQKARKYREKCQKQAERREINAAKRRKEREEKIIINLNNPDKKVRQKAFSRYFSLEMKDSRAYDALVNNFLLKGEGDVQEVIWALARDNNDHRSDKIIVEYFEKNAKAGKYNYGKHSLDDLLEWLPEESKILLERLIEERDEKEEEQEELRAEYVEKMQEVSETIRDELCERLGIDYSCSTISGESGNYGQVSFGGSMRLVLQMKPVMKMETKLCRGNFIKIDEGDTIEDIRERIKTLNFLVFHEVAHLVMKKIRLPEIGEYSSLNQVRIEHMARELVLDKMAFQIARDIYVYTEEDVELSAEERERISIEACLTLLQINLKNLEAKKQTLSIECIIRFIAVLHEIAGKTEDFRGKALEAAAKFKEMIMQRQNKKITDEINRLIEEFRALFANYQ